MPLSYAVIRIPFILANGLCLHVATSSPNPPPNANERRKFAAVKGSQDFLTRHSWWTTRMNLAVMDCLLLSEIYVILSTVYPDLGISVLRDILLPSTPEPAIYQFSPSWGFLLGTLLVIFGTYIRIACYRTLGRYFTFELSIKPEHKLITTGPYSIVRHPSYTGLLIARIGLAIAQLGNEGSWWIECGLWQTTSWRAFGIGWILVNIVQTGLLLSRIPKEDMVMRNEFKEKWSEWSKKTPYRLIPFVY